MSSFIEDGASEISAFASIPLNEAFRRLPTSTHTFIGLSMVVSITLCGRRRFGALREVRLALFQEGRKCLFRILRTDLYAELFVLGLHRRLDLLTERLLHQLLAGLQRGGRLRRQF